MALSLEMSRFEIPEFRKGSCSVRLTLCFSEDDPHPFAQHPAVTFEVAVPLTDDATVEAIKVAALSEAKRLSAAAIAVLENIDAAELNRINEAFDAPNTDQ